MSAKRKVSLFLVGKASRLTLDFGVLGVYAMPVGRPTYRLRKQSFQLISRGKRRPRLTSSKPRKENPGKPGRLTYEEAKLPLHLFKPRKENPGKPGRFTYRLRRRRWPEANLAKRRNFTSPIRVLPPILPSPVHMSWKRAQTHAESMLENLGIGEKLKGRKDLRGKKVVFVDDGLNPYRTMCFTIAAKLVKKRGAEIETLTPGPGEVPHAKVVEAPAPPKPKVQRPINRR